MAAGSEHVSYKKYGVKQVCSGCGRKLRGVGDEPALWFRTLPTRGVWGQCCFNQGAKT